MEQTELRLYLPSCCDQIIFYPELAKEIGANESIILLTIDTLSVKDGIKRDGHRWTFLDAKRSKQNFGWLGVTAINKLYASMVEKGLLLEAFYNVLRRDTTRWLTVNYRFASTLDSVIIATLHGKTPTVFHQKLPDDKPVTGELFDLKPEDYRINDENSSPNSSSSNKNIYNTNTAFDESSKFYNVQPEGEFLYQKGTSPVPPKTETYADREWRIISTALMETCNMNPAMMTGREHKELKEAKAMLRRRHPDKSPDDLAKLIRGFGIWWEGKGENFDPPSLLVLRRHWENYIRYCKDKLNGHIPVK